MEPTQRVAAVGLLLLFSALLGTVLFRQTQNPVATTADWFQHNCFKLLEEPLADPPFGKEEIQRLVEHFRGNFDVNRTGAIIASPGSTPALGLHPAAGYRYHWIRDGGLSMSALLHVADTYGLPTDMEDTFLQYVDWVELLHQRNGLTTIDEPKWNIQQAEPFSGGWCRPQTDGPPLRALTLMQAARRWKTSAGRFWNLAKKDLDWLVAKQADGTSNINKETCDLWEETQSTDFFWNKAVMEAALLEGMRHSQEVGDAERAQTYLQALRNELGDVTERHKYFSFFEGKYLTECPTPRFAGDSCRKFRKQIDGAVILALVHGRTKVNTTLASVPLPTSVLAANHWRS